MNMSPSSSPRRPRQLSVAFANQPLTRVEIIPSLSDITEEEKANIWLSQQDLANIKTDMREAVISMRGISRADSKTSEVCTCTRGLEHLKSSSVLKELQAMKDIVVDAVLDEQERQQKAGIIDDLSIAAVSSMHSRLAILRAKLAGSSDAAILLTLNSIREKGTSTYNLEEALKLSHLVQTNNSSEHGKLQQYDFPLSKVLVAGPANVASASEQDDD